MSFASNKPLLKFVGLTAVSIISYYGFKDTQIGETISNFFDQQQQQSEAESRKDQTWLEQYITRKIKRYHDTQNDGDRQPDFIDEIAKLFDTTDGTKKFVLGVASVCAIIGGAIVVADLLDVLTDLANQQPPAAQQVRRLGHDQNNNIIINFRHNNHHDPPAAQQRPQQQREAEHGPRINRDFMDRMEYFGARQPPIHYQPQAIREDQTGTVPCCVVCMANARDTVCEPCGHLVMDWGCAMAMTEHAEDNGNRHVLECPVCRQRVEAFSFVMMT